MIQSGKTQEQAADKAGIDVKTGRKYLRAGKSPSQMLKQSRSWKTRANPFEDVWPQIVTLLQNEPALQGKTIFEYIQEKFPGKFKESQLRTLQRKIRKWRSTEGPTKEVYFSQIHYPGQLCASDFTDMNQLSVTISGKYFKHMVFHFVLTYSNWEHVSICFSESFQSLSAGLQNALWDLGGVPVKHRSDRLTAAVNNLGNKAVFQKSYLNLMNHLGIKPEHTNPHSGHENGDVEQSHHRFKVAVDQALMLRGYRDFNSVEEYRNFLQEIIRKKNLRRMDRFQEERKILKPLPSRRLEDCIILLVSVSKGSTITVAHNVYSVPSKLIGERVTVRLFPDYLELFHGDTKIEEIPRISGENRHYIQYRHVIYSLIRKPGAFENYKYQSDMFPATIFRMAYDALCSQDPVIAVKEYLNILYLAATENEEQVETILQKIIDSGQKISASQVKNELHNFCESSGGLSLEIENPDLSSYDSLLEAGYV